MEIPIWAILLATAWKLANETVKIILDHRAEMKKLDSPDPDK